MYLVMYVQKFYSMSCDSYPDSGSVQGKYGKTKSSFYGSGYPHFPVQLKREVCKILKIPQYYPNIAIFIVSSLVKMTHGHF